MRLSFLLTFSLPLRQLSSPSTPSFDVRTDPVVSCSIRICVTAALTKKEIEKAGNVVKSAISKVLGKGSRR